MPAAPLTPSTNGIAGIDNRSEENLRPLQNDVVEVARAAAADVLHVSDTRQPSIRSAAVSSRSRSAFRVRKSSTGREHHPVRHRAADVHPLEHDLVDELHLWMHPLFVGEASTDDLLFRPSRPHQFSLVDRTTLTSGIAILRYTPANR